MNREELMEILPHREPMLLLDEAHAEEDGTATAHYTVRGDEFFLKGHFPDYPVVPGVILCEILAQSACVIITGENKKVRTLYTGISEARFRSQVRPGDTLTIKCAIDRAKGPFYFLSGSISVGDTLCMTGKFSVAVIPVDD